MIRLRPQTVPDAILLSTGAACALLGLAALAGWLFHFPSLTRFGPSYAPMAANAATALLLDGVALLTMAAGRPRLALAGAIGSLLAGGLTLVEDALSVDLHVDQFLVRDYIGAYAHNPGRMAPNSAVCLILAGGALLWLVSQRGEASGLAGVLGSVILALGASSIAGHLSGFELQSWGSWTPMAANAALGFALLGLGIVMFAWQYGGLGRAGSQRWLGVAAGCGGLTLSIGLGIELGTWLDTTTALAIRLLGDKPEDAAVAALRHAEPRILSLLVIVIGALISVLTAFIVELIFKNKRRAEDAELANARLRTASSELAAIHANAPVAFLVVGHDLRVEKVNALATQFAGASRPQLLEPRSGDVMGCLNALSDPRGCGHGPACGECAVRQSILEGVRAGKRRIGLEAWLPFSIDGHETRRCLLISVVPLQNGRKKALVCFQDLTDRKQAEVELQRKARLIDLCPDAIIRTDAARTILGWNAGAEELYGWKFSEAFGKTLHDLLTTQGAVPAEIDKILSRDGRWEGKLAHTCRDGRQIVMESRQVLVRDEAGAPVEILEINRDITEREKAREELVAAHDRTTAILENIPDGFNLFDRDWRYTYVNPAAARLVHKSPEELMGKSLWELWPHTAHSPFGAAFRRAVAENTQIRFEAFYPEPLNAWFEVGCYPTPEGLALFFTDTTARKNAEEKLQDTVRALESALAEKTVLLKEVHHRVKNNLAVIVSLLSMRASASEDAAVRLALDESQQRVHSIALIHEQLYGSDHLDRIAFADYAQELVQQLCASHIDRAEWVSVHLDSDPIEIDIHRAVPCGLILNELLSNVFKHAFPHQRQGNVKVVFKEDGRGSLELAVEDDGVGLGPGWEKSKSLGLQIMRILARQLEGSLTSEPSSGTRFVLRFPLGAACRK